MSRKEETLSWKKFKSGSWLLSFIFSLTISELLRDNVSSVAFGAISVYDFSEQSSEAAIRGIPKMSTHPHQAGVTHIPNSSSACQKLCLFTHISTFSPTFLPQWVFMLKTLNKSSAVTVVKCCVYYSKLEPTLPQNLPLSKLLEQKHLFDWKTFWFDWLSS